MKSLMEQLLDSLDIPTRDDDGNIRSAEDLTADVLALIETCNTEDAGRLLFMLLIAKHMEEEDEKLNERIGRIL